jgi:nitrite reductase/ring-hydroxylating ferredoxin subunit
MAGEDQERFEDYLELEHYIEELQAGRVAHPPRDLTPGQASIYHVAALFRAASIAQSQPRPAFAAELQARLEQELRQPAQPHHPAPRGEKPTPPCMQRPPVSRRSLLRSGAAAAATLAVGVGLGATGMGLAHPSPTGPATMPRAWSTQLVPGGQGGWLPVAKLADLGDEALRFATDSIVGYVIQSDGDQGEKPGVIAVSAACSHMGCLVNWQHDDRKYHCPCHGGIFTEYGKPDEASPVRYAALPRMETRITRHGTEDFVEVRVPSITGTT